MGKSEKMKWLITILTTIAIMLTPVNEVYTAEIRLFLAITVCMIMIAAFEFFDILVPSILLPTAYYISGLVPIGTAFGGWTQSTAYMIFGSFLFANVLDESGVMKRIALWFIRKMGGTFNKVLYGLLLVGIIIEVLSVNSGYALIITIGYAICKSMGLQKSKEAGVVMMASATAALTVGCFLYRPSWAGIIQSGIQTAIPEFTFEYLDLPFYNLPCVILIFVYVFVLTKIYRTGKVNTGDMQKHLNEEYEKLGKMSIKEMKALFLTIALLVYVVLSPVHGLPVVYGFMIIPFLFFFPGIRIATNQSIKNLNFGMIMFAVSCLGIGGVSTSLGFNELISYFISPILDGQSTTFIMLLTMAIGTVANLVLTPLAVLTCFSPVLGQLCVDLSLNPWAVISPLIYSTDMYFMPHEVAVLLLLYGFNMMSMKDFIVMSTWKVIVLGVGFFVLQVPWLMFLGVL